MGNIKLKADIKDLTRKLEEVRKRIKAIQEEGKKSDPLKQTETSAKKTAAQLKDLARQQSKYFNEREKAQQKISQGQLEYLKIEKKIESIKSQSLEETKKTLANLKAQRNEIDRIKDSTIDSFTINQELNAIKKQETAALKRQKEINKQILEDEKRATQLIKEKIDAELLSVSTSNKTYVALQKTKDVIAKELTLVQKRNEEIRKGKNLLFDATTAEKLLLETKRRELSLTKRIVQAEQNRADQVKKVRDAATALRQSFFTGAVIGATVIYPLKQIVDEAAKAETALIALDRQARASGLMGDRAINSARSMDIVKNGLISIGEASKAIRNLMRIGFDLDEAVKATRQITEIAIENKQAALSLGQALVSTTEGARQELSVLADAGGITKNLSVIYKEYAATLGKTAAQLTKREKALAFFNEVQREQAISAGSLDSITKTLTGSTTALSGAWTILLQTLGLQGKPVIIGIQKIITKLVKEVNSLADTIGGGLLVNVGLITGGVGALAAVLGSIGTIIPVLKGGFTAAIGYLGLTMPSLTAIIAGVGLLATGLTVLTNVGKKAALSTSEMNKYVKDFNKSLDKTYFDINKSIKKFDDLEKSVNKVTKRFKELGVSDVVPKELTSELDRIKGQLLSLDEVQSNSFLQAKIKASEYGESLNDVLTTLKGINEASLKMRLNEQITNAGKAIEYAEKLLAKPTDFSLKDAYRSAITEAIDLVDNDLVRDELNSIFSGDNADKVFDGLRKRIISEGKDFAYLTKEDLAKELGSILGGIKGESVINDNLSIFKYADNFGKALSTNLKKVYVNGLKVYREEKAKKDELQEKLRSLYNLPDGKDVKVDSVNNLGDLLSKAVTGVKEYSAKRDKAVEILRTEAKKGGKLSELYTKFIDSIVGGKELSLSEQERESIKKVNGLETALDKIIVLVNNFNKKYAKQVQEAQLRATKSIGRILPAIGTFDQLDQIIKQYNFQLLQTDEAFELNLKIVKNLEKIADIKKAANGELTAAQADEIAALELQNAQIKTNIQVRQKTLELTRKEVKAELDAFKDVDSEALKTDAGRQKQIDINKQKVKRLQELNRIYEVEYGVSEKETSWIRRRVNDLDNKNKALEKQLGLMERVKNIRKETNRKLLEINATIQNTTERAKEREKLYRELAEAEKNAATSEEAAAYSAQKTKVKKQKDDYKGSGFGITARLQEIKAEQESLIGANQQFSDRFLELTRDREEERLKIIQDTQNQMHQTFASGYADIINQSKSFSDVMFDVFNNFQNRLNNIIGEQISENLFGSLFESIAGGLIGGATGDSGGGFGNIFGGSKSRSKSRSKNGGGSFIGDGIYDMMASDVNININAIDSKSLGQYLGENRDARESLYSSVMDVARKR